MSRSPISPLGDRLREAADQLEADLTQNVADLPEALRAWADEVTAPPVPPGRIVQIAAGQGHLYALASDGRLWRIAPGERGPWLLVLPLPLT